MIQKNVAGYLLSLAMVWWREDPWFQWKNSRVNEKIGKLGICHHYATVCLRFDSVPQMFAVRSISRKGNNDVQFQAGIDVFPCWCGSLLLWRELLQHINVQFTSAIWGLLRYHNVSCISLVLEWRRLRACELMPIYCSLCLGGSRNTWHSKALPPP